jgi:hypothetical protein
VLPLLFIHRQLMMSITQAKSSANPAQEQYWKEHVAKQKESGLSVTTYCRQHQLNYDRFYYWVRKEKRAAPRLIPIELKSVAADSVSTIAMEPRVVCTLTFKGGGILEIHDKSALPIVLSVLR